MLRPGVAGPSQPKMIPYLMEGERTFPKQNLDQGVRAGKKKSISHSPIELGHVTQLCTTEPPPNKVDGGAA